MTTTIEITAKLERLAIQLQDGENALLKLAAQRLRGLDKPDCVWHKVGETFDTACNARYRDGAYSTWKTCPNCSGSIVKDST